MSTTLLTAAGIIGRKRSSPVMPIFCLQAEDGRRDGTVTGVQTCALPISAWLQITAGEIPASAHKNAADISATISSRLYVGEPNGAASAMDARLRRFGWPLACPASWNKLA